MRDHQTRHDGVLCPVRAQHAAGHLAVQGKRTVPAVEAGHRPPAPQGVVAAVLLTLAVAPAFAQSARECVRVEHDAGKFRNVRSRNVYIAWCISEPNEGFNTEGGVRCGEEHRLGQLGRESEHVGQHRIRVMQSQTLLLQLGVVTDAIELQARGQRNRAVGAVKRHASVMTLSHRRCLPIR